MTARSPWRGILFWCVVWALAGAGLAWLARSIDWAGVRLAMSAADPVWVLAAFLANLLGLPLWIWAWRVLIPAPPSIGRLFESQSVTLAAIQSLSILGGGFVAFFMLVRRAGLTYARAVSVLALDQVLTGLVKLILVAAAVAFAPAPPAMRTAGLGLLAAVTVLTAILLFVSFADGFAARWAKRRDGLGARISTMAAELARSLAAARSPGRFALALAIYLARRSMEGVAAYFIQRACGLTPSWETALLVMAVLLLATVMPGPPGNLGFYEAAVGFAYTRAGVPAELALAMALLQHVAYLAAAVLPGYIVLAVNRPWKRPVLSSAA